MWQRLVDLWRFGFAQRPLRQRHQVPQDLWQAVLASCTFLTTQYTDEDLARLYSLTCRFLAGKEFFGVRGFVVTEEMAVAIAAQACLPLLYLDGGGKAESWYDDFIGIVVHRDDVVARRETADGMGVVHVYDEVLSGEAMQHGPVMLSWSEVKDADLAAQRGCNLVIHEFIHKIDMRDGTSDGCPPLPSGFRQTRSRREARTLWLTELTTHYTLFCDQVSGAERFGQAPPWLDAYAAQSLDEFFAVTCEAYFVNRPRFTSEYPGLVQLYDDFFRPQIRVAAPHH